MLPEWASGYQDVLDSAVEAHGRATNLPASGGTGRRVHIGIIDSVCAVPDHLAEGHVVNQGSAHSFVDSTDDVTHPHGTEVFDIASAYCPGATFSVYQAVTEEKSVPLRAYDEAVEQAIADDVDVLNVSAGDPWPGPVEVNPNVPITEKAIRDGITVVAAAGNADDDGERPPVHCPAAVEEVIAVAGLVTYCPGAPGDEPSDERRGPFYYLEDEERTALCSRSGCVDGASCISEQTEAEWTGNPQPTRNKPDVLAPVTRPVDYDGEIEVSSGTSFAAPIVTASLGRIFSELREQEREIPAPYRVREVVREASFPLVDSNVGKYDGIETRNALNLA